MKQHPEFAPTIALVGWDEAVPRRLRPFAVAAHTHDVRLADAAAVATADPHQLRAAVPRHRVLLCPGRADWSVLQPWLRAGFTECVSDEHLPARALRRLRTAVPVRPDIDVWLRGHRAGLRPDEYAAFVTLEDLDRYTTATWLEAIHETWTHYALKSLCFRVLDHPPGWVLWAYQAYVALALLDSFTPDEIAPLVAYSDGGSLRRALRTREIPAISRPPS